MKRIFKSKTKVTADEVHEWFSKDRESHLSPGECAEYLHQYHPRTIFLKTLRYEAKVLDIGAGDGALPNFKNWIKPFRPDLRLYAYSLEKGVNFDAYDGYEIGDWVNSKPEFGNMKFDAIFCSHFIEHIENPMEFMHWAASKLELGGRIYVEWPSENSVNMPKLGEFDHKKINIMISNFHDDTTHKKLPNIDKIILSLENSGLSIDQMGFIRIPYMEDEVLARFGCSNDDRSAVQLAFWSKYRWSQYVIASKY